MAVDRMDDDSSPSTSESTDTGSTEVENQISERLAANHIQDNNQTTGESSNVIVDMLLAPGRLVGGWMSWFVAGTDNNSTDISSTEKGLEAVVERILSYVDDESLAAAELVCKKWYNIINEKMLWKKLIERKVRIDSMWRGLAQKKGWIKHLFESPESEPHPNSAFYRKLFFEITRRDIKNLENNWQNGIYNLQKIDCQSNIDKGVYCFQYDSEKIISGLRDDSIKIWDRKTLKCIKTIIGHTGSVLCLQFDDNVIVSGSSDSTVRVWDVISGDLLNTQIHHTDAVLSLKFQNNILITCSKDRSIAVWDMTLLPELQLLHLLVGHTAAVNCIDFDEKYIISASGDQRIKVWNTCTGELIRTLAGHKRGIASLQFCNPLIVTGSSDNSVRLWDVESGACIRSLSGHDSLVRSICFDNKYIISGDYSGSIKIWDLPGAFDPKRLASSLCLHTLKEHTSHVFQIQFDDFKIVSSSHDDTIIIRDFLNLDNTNESTSTIAACGKSSVKDNQFDNTVSTASMTEDESFVVV